MCEISCWSALREQIIDNVVAMGTYSSRETCIVATVKNDAGYQAFVTRGQGLNSSTCVPFKSTYCNDTTQALKSLLGVVQAEAWKIRERAMTNEDKAELAMRRYQLSGIHPRPTF
ncbi:hypothetical protein BDZ91DRAFT_765571 [Kalaharituber pfeilii]|nr:hypothetical protein BDZ91DRAFT_765571 [Kalaharituber pfeilii]